MDKALIKTPDPELEAAAEDELQTACSLSWRELARVTPWGDDWEGFGPAGSPVHFERNYIWLDREGGDILCEVRVYRGQTRYDHGALATRVIARAGA
ncbi:MAG: hypothetical protein JWO33_2639 [Caulobacteraceae bacterium]|nr:hypothetical protein [Caulobacteraceae bacterium]